MVLAGFGWFWLLSKLFLPDFASFLFNFEGQGGGAEALGAGPTRDRHSHRSEGTIGANVDLQDSHCDLGSRLLRSKKRSFSP